MEITVDKLEKSDCKYSYDGYTVYVGDHRILTISTLYDATATKWIKEVHKSHRNKHRPLVVGVSADRYPKFGGGNGDPKHSPYNLLELCIGSHCLIYHLPEPDFFQIPKALQSFFADPCVVAVGMDMVSVAKKLQKDHQIKFAKPMDLNAMAVMGMTIEDFDLAYYSLDRLAEIVLGQDMYVVRPRLQVQWFNSRGFYWHDRGLSNEKVKYATLDPYFCFLIGSELLNKINRPSSSSSSKKKKKKKY